MQWWIVWVQVAGVLNIFIFLKDKHNSTGSIYRKNLSLIWSVLNDLSRTRLSRRRMIWLHLHPLPPPVSILSLILSFLCVAFELTYGRGVGGGGGAKSCDGKKAWSCINHSLLSACASFCASFLLLLLVNLVGLLTALKNPVKWKQHYAIGSVYRFPTCVVCCKHLIRLYPH
jgi:hypothetical protein